MPLAWLVVIAPLITTRPLTMLPNVGTLPAVAWLVGTRLKAALLCQRWQGWALLLVARQKCLAWAMPEAAHQTSIR